MHTFKANDATFDYNSDFSGDVHITAYCSELNRNVTIELKADAVRRFVAVCYILPRKIAEIEQATVDELLK
jgi:hypothetical protein